MKLKEFIENIIELSKHNPEILEYDVVSSSDGEGNSFEEVYYTPSLGYFDNEEREFISQSNIEEEPEGYDEDIEINAICIN